MKPNTKALLLALATLLLFIVVEIATELWLTLEPTPRWILRGGLAVLGLAATLLVFFLLRKPEPRDPAGDAAVERVEQAFKGAARRLRTSALKSGARLRKLPAVLLMGPSGSAKTTVVTHSGINPELLAGEPRRGDQVIPTTGLNLWFGKGAVLVEAGGPILDSPRAWNRLARRLRPARLGAAILGRGQASRAAVVCVPADEFQRPDSRERLKTLSGVLRDRLNAVSRRVGVRLPVYVLVTRADRIPHFEEFVSAFTGQEAEQGLGASLPMNPDPDLGAYAAQEGQRIQAAFAQVVQELTEGRLTQLPRMRDGVIRGAAYEFSREVGKMSEVATEFMLELCRPSQLDMSPFLRGFYFTGVRPVTAEGAAAPVAPSPAAQGPVAGATAVFNVQALNDPQVAAPAGGQRRVPQWVHLPPFLPGVVLADDNARRVTSGGAGVNAVRRLLLYAALVLLLGVGFGVTRSYLGNRALERRATAALTGLGSLPPGESALPELAELQRLDSLRAVAADLRAFEDSGPPRRLGWGLYQGSRLLEPVRSAYFRGFQRMLWNGAYQGLQAELVALPDTANETSDYGATYDVLKAYLIVTEHPGRSTADFLAPVLRDHWLAGRGLDAERQGLVDDQMAFYAAELPNGDPYEVAMDPEMVESTRRFLGQFADDERFFQSLVSAASDSIPGVDFRRDVPEGEGIVVASVAVPGAYTADGWTLVHERLDNIDQFLASEEWVLGDLAPTARDRTRLAERLQARYAEAYRDIWIRFLSEASVARYRSASDAANKLGALGGNLSPLLQLLALASNNTAVDTVQVGPVFQPVRQVVAPDQPTYVGPSNQPYLRGLRGLQAAMSKVAQAQGDDRAAAAEEAGGPAGDARAAAQETTGTFSVSDLARPVSASVSALLVQPIDHATGLIRVLPQRQAEAAGTAYCTGFNRVTGRFPFAPGATREATIDEVAGLLAPGSGSLWAYVEGQLGSRVQRQGDRFVARPGAATPVSEQFLAFLNRAATVSTALFPGGSPTPAVQYTLRAVTTPELPQITLVMAGQSRTWTPTQAGSQPFIWEGQGERVSQVIGTVEGATVTVVEQPAGPWSVFRILQLGDWQTRQPGVYEIRWPVPEREFGLAVELRMVSGQPIFRSDFMAGLRCVSSVAR